MVGATRGVPRETRPPVAGAGFVFVEDGDMLKRLDDLERRALGALQEVSDENGLQSWKVAYLGRSAELGQILDSLRAVPKEERPAVGRRANEVKSALEQAFESRRTTMGKETLDRSLRHDRLDVTLPGRPWARGRLHP